MLFLTIHALERMRERFITRDEVIEARASRETTYPSEDDPGVLVILGTTRDGRRLKVFVDAADECVIVSVMDRDGG